MGFLGNWLEKRIDLSNVDSITGNIEDRLATKLLAYYIASSYVFETLGKCEIKHYVNGEEKKDKWYYLLNISPNINQNATQFKTQWLKKLFYDGEVLIFENKGSLYVADGFIKDSKPLSGDVFDNISIDNETKTFKRKASDVFYFDLDDGELKRLVDSMINDLCELLKYSFTTYQSTNSEKYKLKLDEIKMGDKDFNEKLSGAIKKQLETFLNNPKSVYIQFKGYDLQEMKSPDRKTDSTDVRNIKKEIFETTAQTFKMPVSMLYGNMTNVKDIISSFITFAIEPKAKMISEELTRKTSTMDEYANGTYFDIDTTSIMHHDIFEIADPISKLVSSGVYDIDDILKKLGEQPLNTDFSKQHWMTKNFDKIENVMNGISESADVKGGE